MTLANLIGLFDRKNLFQL